MFSLRDYIKDGFIKAVGKMSDYQIILSSAGYLEKGVLQESDLEEINLAIQKQYEVSKTVNEETEIIEIPQEDELKEIDISTIKE